MSRDAMTPEMFRSVINDIEWLLGPGEKADLYAAADAWDTDIIERDVFKADIEWRKEELSLLRKRLEAARTGTPEGVWVDPSGVSKSDAMWADPLEAKSLGSKD